MVTDKDKTGVVMGSEKGMGERSEDLAMVKSMRLWWAWPDGSICFSEQRDKERGEFSGWVMESWDLAQGAREVSSVQDLCVGQCSVDVILHRRPARTCTKKSQSGLQAGYCRHGATPAHVRAYWVFVTGGKATKSKEVIRFDKAEGYELRTSDRSL